MAENYSIRSRSHACCITAEAFVEDQPFITALYPDPESSSYLRQDYSLPAWDARESDAEVPFSYWRSVYKPPQKEEKVEVTPQDPEALFSKLVEEDEEHTANARFILAAMLERKKLLRETDTQQTGSGLLRIYEHRKTGDVFIVRDPQIPLDQVDTIQEEVHRLLDPESYPSPEEDQPEAEETKPETNGSEATNDAPMADSAPVEADAQETGEESPTNQPTEPPSEEEIAAA
ncbi:MAG: hypothetical protein Q7Q71_16140 [Verrucomicrobiota bacterium JB023]|nr:hypothetical protein [Verrucomicrobiota bacterium JB023]